MWLSESLNQRISTAREKSYLDILIRATTKMMTIFHERLVKYNKSETIYCQKNNYILDQNDSTGRKVDGATMFKFFVLY